MTDCRTRSEFLIRALRLGFDPDQLIAICGLHARGLGLDAWEELPANDQDEVISDLLDRVEMLNRAGLVLIDGARLEELVRAERTLQHLATRAIERMQEQF